MQVNHNTREAFAMSRSTVPGFSIELVTIAPRSYMVWMWDEKEDEVIWTQDFGSDIGAAVEGYNAWADTKETAPCFN